MLVCVDDFSMVGNTASPQTLEFLSGFSHLEVFMYRQSIDFVSITPRIAQSLNIATQNLSNNGKLSMGEGGNGRSSKGDQREEKY